MEEIDIYVAGDSIVYGEGDDLTGGWTNQLKVDLLKETDYFYRVYSMGIPGDNSEDLLKRFKYEMDIHHKGFRNLIIFGIGINDTQIFEDHNVIPVEQFKDNIISLIKQARAYTDRILFLGLSKVDETKVTPIPWDSEISYRNEEIRKYDEILRKVTEENNVDYIPLFDEIDGLYDGLHPDHTGHRIIKDKVLNYIKDRF